MEFVSLWNKKFFSSISMVDNTLLSEMNDLAIVHSDEITICNVNMKTPLGCLKTVLQGKYRTWAY